MALISRSVTGSACLPAALVSHATASIERSRGCSWPTGVLQLLNTACTFANHPDTPNDMRKFGKPLCPKLESEIFNTGLAIIAFILLLIVTSYFRIPRRLRLIAPDWLLKHVFRVAKPEDIEKAANFVDTVESLGVPLAIRNNLDKIAVIAAGAFVAKRIIVDCAGQSCGIN